MDENMPPWTRLQRLQRLSAYLEAEIELGRSELIRAAAAQNRSEVIEVLVMNNTLQQRRHLVANMIDRVLVQAALPINTSMNLPGNSLPPHSFHPINVTLPLE